MSVVRAVGAVRAARRWHEASSHLPQAQSEILVPAGHAGTLYRPETTAEIERILHQTTPAAGTRAHGG